MFCLPLSLLVEFATAYSRSVSPTIASSFPSISSILNEFSRHLSGKFGHSQADTKQRLDFLREVAQIVELDNITDGCRDKDDLPVLGTLTAGQADCLVTGDKDLLIPRQFKGLPILSPRQFKMVGNGRPYS